MPLTLAQAHVLIAAAHEHAAANSWKIAVAVVDEGGLLVALGRMDGAFPLSAQIAEAKAAGAVTVNYGLFINNLLAFLIVALAVFLVVRAINRMYRKPAPAAPNTKACAFCATAIPLAATRCPNCTSQLAATSV